MVVKKYLGSLIALLIFILILVSCVNGNEVVVNNEDIIGNSGITIEDLGVSSIVEESEYFTILYGNNHYYFYIYDINGGVVKEGGFHWRSPSITVIHEDILKFRIQLGTGISTIVTFYYDIKEDNLSPQYFGVFDETDELLVYSHYGTLIICSIFNKADFYYEVSNFSDIASDLNEPFICARFSDDGCRIIVTYLRSDYSEVTQELQMEGLLKYAEEVLRNFDRRDCP